MTDRSVVLREAMSASGISQSALARMSGVRQPSISKFLSGDAPLSDDMLARLLQCLGYRLEVVRRAVPAELRGSDRIRWLLHRRLAEKLDAHALVQWEPRILANVAELRGSTQGEPHESYVDRWEQLVRSHDAAAMRQAMTGVDREALEMREVSPLGGILTQADRREALAMDAA